MSGDFPDEWFRPRPGGDGLPGGGAHPDAPFGAGVGTGDEERYTDQFKPGYVDRAPAARDDAPRAPREALPHDDAGRAPRDDAVGPAPSSHSVGVAPHPLDDQWTDAPDRRPGRAVGTGVLLGSVLLVGVGIGWALTRHDATSTSDPRATSAPLASTSTATGSTTSTPTASPSSPAPTPWTGPVEVVRASSVTASCTAPAQQGYDGSTIPSTAERVQDGRLSTGWRCDGDGIGEALTFTFPKGTSVVGVRMTNGYTKTVDGVDLYPQYRRVTQVSWSFPGAQDAWFEQDLADQRTTPQEIRIPPTSTDGGLEMEVQRTTDPGRRDASRDAVVVTEVEFLVRKG